MMHLWHLPIFESSQNDFTVLQVRYLLVINDLWSI